MFCVTGKRVVKTCLKWQVNLGRMEDRFVWQHKYFFSNCVIDFSPMGSGCVTVVTMVTASRINKMQDAWAGRWNSGIYSAVQGLIYERILQEYWIVTAQLHALPSVPKDVNVVICGTSIHVCTDDSVHMMWQNYCVTTPKSITHNLSGQLCFAYFLLR